MKHPSNRTFEAATITNRAGVGAPSRSRRGRNSGLAARASLFVALGACMGLHLACSSNPPAAQVAPEALDGNQCTPGGDDAGSPSDGSVTLDAIANDAASTPSPCGTAVPPAAQIVDANGDVWTLTANAQIARNGVVDTVTQNVVLLDYVDGVVYQNAYDEWWGWENGAWQAASDPRVGATCGGSDAGVQPAPDGGLLYMVGLGGANQSPQQIAAMESAVGRPFDLGTDSVTVDSFQYGPYASSNGRAMGKVLIFEMLSQSWDTNQGLQDMAAAASGAYDGVYTAMAQSIAAFGSPPVSVRIGHEMNGNWYAWSATDGNSHNATTANYIAAFKRIAQIVRKYNPNTLIEWCTAIQPSVPSWSGTNYTPLDYWVGAYDPATNPGGADVISMNFYEGLSGTDFANNIEGGQFGLTWLASFAAQNNVKIGLSEVATGTGSSPAEGNGCPCSNDGAFMQHLVDSINALPPGEFTHFVFSPWTPADDLTSSSNAAIQNVLKQSWGGTRFEGSWWKGPKVPSQP